MNQDPTNFESFKALDQPDREPATVGYVRVSPFDPDVETPAAAVREYAGYYGWIVFCLIFEKLSGMTNWQNRPELNWLADVLKDGDRLVVLELSQLGRHIPDVVSLLAKLHGKGVTICDAKNKLQIDSTISPQMVAMFHAISTQINKGHVAMRTREGLAARKAKGLRLGRKKGVGAPSKLDQHKTEIIDLLKSGSTKTYLIKKYGTSKTNLYHWLKRNGLENVSPVYEEKSNE